MSRPPVVAVPPRRPGFLRSQPTRCRLMLAACLADPADRLAWDACRDAYRDEGWSEAWARRAVRRAQLHALRCAGVARAARLLTDGATGRDMRVLVYWWAHAGEGVNTPIHVVAGKRAPVLRWPFRRGDPADPARVEVGDKWVRYQWKHARPVLDVVR